MGHREREREKERVTEGVGEIHRERERERDREGGGILFIRCKCVQKFVGPDELFNPMAHYLSRFLRLSLYILSQSGSFQVPTQTVAPTMVIAFHRSMVLLSH